MSISKPQRLPFLSLAENPRILTGEHARRSLTSKLRHLRKIGAPEEAYAALPTDARTERRHADRTFARQKRKGQARYTARRRLERFVAADLAHAYSIVDAGTDVLTTLTADQVERVHQSLDSKRQMLIDQTPGMTTAEAEDRLRSIAATAKSAS